MRRKSNRNFFPFLPHCPNGEFLSIENSVHNNRSMMQLSSAECSQQAWDRELLGVLLPYYNVPKISHPTGQVSGEAMSIRDLIKSASGKSPVAVSPPEASRSPPSTTELFTFVASPTDGGEEGPNRFDEETSSQLCSSAQREVFDLLSGFQFPLIVRAGGAASSSSSQPVVELPFSIDTRRRGNPTGESSHGTYLGDGEMSVVLRSFMTNSEATSSSDDPNHCRSAVAVKFIPCHLDGTAVGKNVWKHPLEAMKRNEKSGRGGNIEQTVEEAEHCEAEVKKLAKEMQSLQIHFDLTNGRSAKAASDAPLNIVKCFGVTPLHIVREEHVGGTTGHDVLRIVVPAIPTTLLLSTSLETRTNTTVSTSGGKFGSFLDDLSPLKGETMNSASNHLRATPVLSMCAAVLELGHDTVQDVLRRYECLPEHIVRKILCDVLDALIFLHGEKGLVHHDIKPANLILVYDIDPGERVEDMMTDEAAVSSKLRDLRFRCLITDFGQATRWAPAIGSKTCSAKVIGGTPLYMSPEACNNVVTPTSDIWALGIMAIQLLTGRLPWTPLETQYHSLIVNGFRSNWRHRLDSLCGGGGDVKGGGEEFKPQVDELLDACYEGGSVSLGLLGIVKRCLSMSHSDRPDALSMRRALCEQ